MPTDTVRSVCNDSDGEVLAPERTACEPPSDCLECTRRDRCEKFAYYEDEVEELEEYAEDEED